MLNIGQIKLRYQIAVLVTVAILIFMALIVWHKNERITSEREFIAMQRATVVESKRRKLEDTFNHLYQNIRTISLLPSVRSIQGDNRKGDEEDVVASGRFTAEGRETVQQIYNNLASNVRASEVYAVVNGLDAAKGEVPFFMYDTLAFGDGPAETTAASGTDTPEESEAAEYAYFPKQMSLIQAGHGQFNFTDLDQIPAFASPLMRTCDNTQYNSKAQGNERDTFGFLYSVPFYGTTDRQFKGVISGIIRANVFEALLMDVPFVPVTQDDKTAQSKAGWELPQPSAFLLSNDKHSIRIADRRATQLVQLLEQGVADRNTIRVKLSVHSESDWVLSYYLPEAAIRAAGSDTDRIFYILCLVNAGVLVSTIVVLWLMRLAKRKAVKEVGQVFKSMADGDLTRRMHGRFDATLDRLKHDSNRTIDKLNDMLRRIKLSGETIHEAAQDVAQGSDSLNQRIIEESTGLGSAAVTLGGLAQKVQTSAGHAQRASRKASEASAVAGQGGASVGQVAATMSEINDASKRIFDIISVIDGIAFQTNILALNAAVEAARAGEQGRGFAVVASEVRSLAQRSATAAREIKVLISNSEEKVAAGTLLVGQASGTMGNVVTAIQEATDLIAEIAAAISEQSSDISQINKTIVDMANGTRVNAELVQKASAAAVSLENQSMSLREAISSFTLESQTQQRPIKD